MAKRSQTREVINQAVTDGDAMAALAARDKWEEMSAELLKPIEVGQMITIFGVPYFYRGIYLGEDHEMYYLAPGAFKCYETGPLAQFQEEQKGTNEEVLKSIVRVRKGCVSSIIEL